MRAAGAVVGRKERPFQVNAGNAGGNFGQLADRPGDRGQRVGEYLVAIGRQRRQVRGHAERVLRQGRLADLFDGKLRIVEFDPAVAVDLQIDEARPDERQAGLFGGRFDSGDAANCDLDADRAKRVVAAGSERGHGRTPGGCVRPFGTAARRRVNPRS